MSGTAISPGGITWTNPPPRPPTMPSLERVGTFGRFLWGLRYGPWISAAKMALQPTSLAPSWYDEMPQNDFERALFRKARDLEKEGVARDQVQEWFDKERQAHRNREPRPEPEPTPTPRPVPLPPTRVSQRELPCLVGEYSKIYDACTALSGETHHVVPDMAYRLGGRPSGSGMSSTNDRIPNAPTLNQGMSICLTSAQHGSGPTGIHGRLRGALRTAGSPPATPVAGTAPMSRILAESIKALNGTAGVPDKCKALAAAATTRQVRNKTGFSAPGRAWERPLPTKNPAAYKVLDQGHY